MYTIQYNYLHSQKLLPVTISSRAVGKSAYMPSLRDAVYYFRMTVLSFPTTRPTTDYETTRGYRVHWRPIVRINHTRRYNNFSAANHIRCRGTRATSGPRSCDWYGWCFLCCLSHHCGYDSRWAAPRPQNRSWCDIDTTVTLSVDKWRSPSILLPNWHRTRIPSNPPTTKKQKLSRVRICRRREAIMCRV